MLAGLIKDAYRHDSAGWVPKLGRKKSHRWAGVLPSELSRIGKTLRAALKKHKIGMGGGEGMMMDPQDVTLSKEDVQRGLREEGMLIGDHIAAKMMQAAPPPFPASPPKCGRRH